MYSSYGPLNYAAPNYDIMNYGRSYIPASPTVAEGDRVAAERAYYNTEEENRAYLEPMNHDAVRKDQIEYGDASSSESAQFYKNRDSESSSAPVEQASATANSDEYGQSFRRNEIDDARKAILDYYRQLESSSSTISGAGAKKTVVSRQQHSDKYKKVQVQEEETGVPRVQVNAGYQNPKIQCEGSVLCSGVLLKWVVTFYGTCVGENCH